VILLIIFLAKWIAEKRDRQKFDWTKDPLYLYRSLLCLIYSYLLLMYSSPYVTYPFCHTATSLPSRPKMHWEGHASRQKSQLPELQLRSPSEDLD
jgi:hypothetical protein